MYLGVTMIPDRLLFYMDEKVAPDAAVNREAWAMYRFGGERWYLRAGRMTLSYGLRLQDQQAFVRQVSGINMDTPDNGMELGYRAGPWDAQFAVSNGAAGGAPDGQMTRLHHQLHHSQRIAIAQNMRSVHQIGG